MTVALFRRKKWNPRRLGSSLAAWYKADAGCYTDAACLFASASSQYLSKTSPTFAPTTKMTIRVSYNQASTAAHTIAARWGGGQDQFIISVQATGLIRVYVAEGGTSDGSHYADGSTVLSDSTPYEIVVDYDGTLAEASRLAVYVNGVAETLAINAAIPAAMTTSTAALEIGRIGVIGWSMDGTLCRLGFSSQALSGAALTAAHTSTFWADMTAARQADWFSFYNLCEKDGTRVDSTGLNNLTPTNGPTVAAGPGEGLATNNSPVKRWEDQSGSGRHLTQSDITKQPLWIASAQNGLPAVRNDGVDDVFASFSHGAASTLAAVFAAKAAGSGSDGLLALDNGVAIHYVGDFGAGSPKTWGYFPADSAAVKSLGAGATTSWQTVLWSYESTSVVRASVSSQAETTCDPDEALGGTAVVFGGNGTPPIDGDLGELFLIADSVPTLAVRNSARAWMKSRWATP